ncbi:MAG: dTDP-4-dehydrorhamnose 3,5-epimerase family protein [Candidatus Firestonebacteria bacterium]
MKNNIIEGVEIKELAVHKDERGFFCEILRNKDKILSEKFVQLNHSLSFAGVTKAWHLHKKQTDWMNVVVGDIKLVLYDTRKNSQTYKTTMEILMGETFGHKVVKIPTEVAHGYKVLNGPMHIVYVTDQEYNPADEFRIPYDDPEIGYDWKSIPAIT